MHEITSEAQLRELLGDPVHPIVVDKSSSVITPPLRRFIEMSPFAALATYGADGSCDVSPRGDPPGFVQVVDEHTLILPERPGNKRLDSIINIIEQGRLSLLFMIPGVLETVRVTGHGVVSTDPVILGRFAIRGKLPEIAVVITVDEAFGHCSKAFRRSKLWQRDYHRAEPTPTLTELMLGEAETDPKTVELIDAGVADDARNRLY